MSIGTILYRDMTRLVSVGIFFLLGFLLALSLIKRNEKTLYRTVDVWRFVRSGNVLWRWMMSLAIVLIALSQGTNIQLSCDELRNRRYILPVAKTLDQSIQ
jgi:hypothetical protein